MLCQDVTAILPKILPFFFQMEEKLKTCPNLSVRDFKGSSSGDYILTTCIS